MNLKYEPASEQVPMVGAVINCFNTRVSADTIAELNEGNRKAFLMQHRFSYLASVGDSQASLRLTVRSDSQASLSKIVRP